MGLLIGLSKAEWVRDWGGKGVNEGQERGGIGSNTDANILSQHEA